MPNHLSAEQYTCAWHREGWKGVSQLCALDIASRNLHVQREARSCRILHMRVLRRTKKTSSIVMSILHSPYQVHIDLHFSSMTI